MASSSIMCIKLLDDETNWSEWYLMKVPVPLLSHQRAFEQARELVKEKPYCEIMNRFGVKLLSAHYHDEQPGVDCPRIEFGQPFGSTYFGCSPGLAVLGNSLYLIGGSINLSQSRGSLRPCSRKKKLKRLRKNKSMEYSTDVYCCQISISDLSVSSFRRSPEMKTPRSEPLVVVLNGKIYVLGDIDHEYGAESPWMEEFDPVLQTWNDLPAPPVKDLANLRFVKDYACAAVDEEIIYATPHEVCFFSVKHKVWHKILTPGKPEGVYGDSITLDGIVYWYWGEENIVFAYDPRTHGWKRECATGVMPYGPNSAVPMAHVGKGCFALLWTLEDGLHCFHFRVSSSGDSSFLLDNEGCVWGELPTPAYFQKCWFIGEESALAES